MKKTKYLSGQFVVRVIFLALLFNFSALYSQDYDVIWQRTAGATYDTLNNSLTKTEGNGWNNSGALSYNRLKRNQDGYVEYIVDNTTDRKAIGLATKNFIWRYKSIDYAFLKNKNKLIIVEHGKVKGNYGRIHNGDTLRVERIGSKIYYFKNGNRLRKRNTNSNIKLFVDVSIFTQGAVFSNIKSSFVRNIRIKHSKENVDPLADKNNGSITLDIKGGLAPFTILWNTGATSETISNLGVGDYIVTVTDYAGQTKSKTITINYEYDVAWERIGGAVYDTTNRTLVKTEIDGWKNSGALSYNILNRNEDGYVEYTVTDLTQRRAFGLSTKNYDWNYRTIDYTFVQRKKKLLIFEHGRIIRNYGNLEVGDVLRIERKNNKIKYFKNGKRIRRKNTNPNYDLFVDVSIFGNGADIKGLKTSFSRRIKLKYDKTDIDCLTGNENGEIQLHIYGGVPPFNIQWNTEQNTASISNLAPGEYTVTVTDFLGQTVKEKININLILEWVVNSGLVINTDNTLSKIANDGWEADGSAYSTNAIAPSEDGYFEMTVDNPNNYKVVGLSTTQTFNTIKNIEYAFYCAKGVIYIYESGKLIGKYGENKIGTQLKIQKVNNQINYYFNDKTIRKTSIKEGQVNSNFYVNVSLYQKDSKLEPITVSFCPIPKPLTIEYTTVNVTENVLGSIQLDVSGGIPPYTYLWELNFLPTIADIQSVIDTITYADSLGLNADSIYNRLVNRYTSSSFPSLYEGSYIVKVVDSIGTTVEKKIYVGTEYDLALNNGLTLTGNTLTKTEPKGSFVNGSGTLNQVFNHSEESGKETEYFWTFTLKNIDGEGVIGLNKYGDDKPSNIQDIDFGIYTNAGTLQVINNSILMDNTIVIKTEDEIALVKKKEKSLALYINNQLVYQFPSIPNDIYYADVLFSQVGYSLANIQIAQLNNAFELPIPWGIVSNITHSTCAAPNTGSINMTAGMGIGSIQSTSWIGPNGYTSSDFDISNLEAGDYSVTIIYTANSWYSSSIQTYTNNFHIGYYVDWLPQTSGINLLPKGGFENLSNNLVGLKSRNILLNGETGWFSFNYRKESSQYSTLNLGLVSNNTSYYQVNESNSMMHIYDNQATNDFLAASSFMHYYKINIDINSRKYRSIASYTYNTPTSQTDFYLQSYIVPNQSVHNVIASFGCPDLPPSYVVLKKKIDGGYYVPKTIDGLRILYFKYTEEYKKEINEELVCNIYFENLESSPDNITNLVVKYGDNRYQIDITSYSVGNYILEVKNNKGEKRYLKFKIE